jgi:predicted metalloendopeptidase
MFTAIKREFEHRIPSYTWLDAATRREMKKKLSNMIATIGYPKKFMSIMELAEYESLLTEGVTSKEKFFQKIGSSMSPNAAKEFHYSKWEKVASNANAYYRRFNNIMVRTISRFILLSLLSQLQKHFL